MIICGHTHNTLSTLKKKGANNIVIAVLENMTSQLTTRLQSIRSLLSYPILILERQIEYGNLLFGFEQNNKYRISNVNNETVGFAIERDRSFGNIVLRQMTRLHRPFVVDVYDQNYNFLFMFNRQFSFINSRLHVWSSVDGVSDNLLIGESQQRWHLWRRRYDLFVNKFDGSTNGGSVSGSGVLRQFGEIDAPFLSFEFPVVDQENKIIGSVDRNWVGLGREFFTDTGVYVVRFDSMRSFKGVYDRQYLSDQILGLNERAVLLANAVSIDFDYFSRHSRGLGTGGGLFSIGGGYGE